MDSAQRSNLAIFWRLEPKSKAFWDQATFTVSTKMTSQIIYIFDPFITKIEIFALLFQHFWLKRTLCSQPCVCVVCGLGVKASQRERTESRFEACPLGNLSWPGHLTMAHDKGIIFQKTIFSLVFLSLFFATTMIWAWILYEVALHVVIGKIESWFESEMLVISTAKHKLESIKEIYAVRLQYSFVYEITKVRWNEKFSPKLSKKESSKVECDFIKDLSPLCTLPTLEHLLHWYP